MGDAPLDAGTLPDLNGGQISRGRGASRSGVRRAGRPAVRVWWEAGWWGARWREELTEMGAAAASGTPRPGPSCGCGGGTGPGGPAGSWAPRSSHRRRSCRRGPARRSSSSAGKTQACKVPLPCFVLVFLPLSPVLFLHFRLLVIVISDPCGIRGSFFHGSYDARENGGCTRTYSTIFFACSQAHC